LKPENLLINASGRTLKITDFGCAEVFKTCFESHSKKGHGICGTDPYIAPEEFAIKSEYEPSKVDIWACGIILYTMYKNHVPWHLAKPSDNHYNQYISKRHAEGYGFQPFDCIIEGPRTLLYKLLEPDPQYRITMKEIEATPYIKGAQMCCIIHQTESMFSPPLKPSTSTDSLKQMSSLELSAFGGSPGSHANSPPAFRRGQLESMDDVVYNTGIRHKHTRNTEL
jgi:serine/threonine protein kinase